MQFEPSGLGEPLGLGGPEPFFYPPVALGLPSMSDITSTFTSWLADDAMVIGALGNSFLSPVGVSTSVYANLDPRMTRTPANAMVAYEQAAYFVALATRRAINMGATGAKTYLSSSLRQILADGEAAADRTNFVCRTTGYLCPVRGALTALNAAIEAISESTLPQDEVLRILPILRRSRRMLLLRLALPWAGLIALGAVAGTYWYRS